MVMKRRTLITSALVGLVGLVSPVHADKVSGKKEHKEKVLDPFEAVDSVFEELAKNKKGPEVSFVPEEGGLVRCVCVSLSEENGSNRDTWICFYDTEKVSFKKKVLSVCDITPKNLFELVQKDKTYNVDQFLKDNWRFGIAVTVRSFSVPNFKKEPTIETGGVFCCSEKDSRWFNARIISEFYKQVIPV